VCRPVVRTRSRKQSVPLLHGGDWVQVALYGTDRSVGSKTIYFDQDEFAPTPEHPERSPHRIFSEAITPPDWWERWTASGTVDVVDECAAGASFSVLRDRQTDSAIVKRMESGLAAMRAVRDAGRLRAIPSAAWWWDRANKHSAEIVALVSEDASVANNVTHLLAAIGPLLDAFDRPLPDDILDHVQGLLEYLAKTASPQLAVEAKRAAIMVPDVRGRSLNAAQDVFARGRQRTLEGDPSRDEPRGAKIGQWVLRMRRQFETRTR
jgi:hypothetical protein